MVRRVRHAGVPADPLAVSPDQLGDDGVFVHGAFIAWRDD